MGAVGGLLKNFRAISLPPGVREWFGLGSLVVLFFLLFFPWVSISAGNETLMSQSGGGVAFGGMTPKNPDIHGLFRDLPGAGLVVIYFLCCLVSLFLLIVVLLSKYGQFAERQFDPADAETDCGLPGHRSHGPVVICALILLLYFLGLSFPVEHLARGDQAVDVMKAGLGSKSAARSKASSRRTWSTCNGRGDTAGSTYHSSCVSSRRCTRRGGG